MDLLLKQLTIIQDDDHNHIDEASWTALENAVDLIKDGNLSYSDDVYHDVKLVEDDDNNRFDEYSWTTLVNAVQKAKSISMSEGML